MGQAKERLSHFLHSHPLCCFCGGSVPAATQDHLPPRTVFKKKKWPVGYVFPACDVCNNGSAEDDAIVGMISRFDPSLSDDDDAESFLQIRAFKERYPEVVHAMRIPAAQRRRYLRTSGFRSPTHETAAEVPLVNMPPRITTALDRVSRKLVKALHYKHSGGRIVPAEAFLATRWWTNLQLKTGAFPIALLDMITGQVPLQRDSVSLLDQFSYRYGLSEDGIVGGYICRFRGAFTVAGLLCFDPTLITDNAKVQAELTRVRQLGGGADDGASAEL
jgi:hypothetical protein